MGIVFNLLGTDAIARSNERLGEDIIRANNKLNNTLKNISNDDIKARNRVNITLEEYENMKERIRSLSSEVDRLKEILERIEVPLDKPIIPNSIRSYWCDNPSSFNRKFMVEFEINHLDLRY